VFVDQEALASAGQRETATALRRRVEGSGGTYRALRRRAGAVDYRAEVEAFMKRWLESEGYR
jgi:hypothetical protein